MPREADGRTIQARRYKQLVQAYSAELGDSLTEADRGMVASAAAIAVRIEKLRSDIVRGLDVAEDAIIRLSSEHRRLLVSLRAKADKRKPAGDAALREHLARYAAPATTEGELGS
jgi:protein-tyrosine-phosphatase